MPDKPLWISRLDGILGALNALPDPWVDRKTIETLLQVGPRRAQQILRPCVTRRLGSSALVHRELLADHLRRLGSGQAAADEQRRRQRFLGKLTQWRQEWLSQPRVLVEVPTGMPASLAELPTGVELGPGRIVVRFTTTQQALEKLLLLALAIGNDFDGFDRLTDSGTKSGTLSC